MVSPNLEPEVTSFKSIGISQCPGRIEGRQSLPTYLQILYTCIGKIDLILDTKTVTFVFEKRGKYTPGILRPSGRVQ